MKDIYIKTNPGETTPEKRRRFARNIVKKLEDNDLLRQEVASLLNHSTDKVLTVREDHFAPEKSEGDFETYDE